MVRVCVLFKDIIASVRAFSLVYNHTLLYLHTIIPDTRPKIKWAISLVIADGHVNRPQRYVNLHVYSLHAVSL